MTRVAALGLLLLGPAAWLSAAAPPWQPLTALALSKDGRVFATGGREGEVLWRDAASGEIEARWRLEGGLPVVALAFDERAATLQAVTLDGGLTALRPGRPAGPVTSPLLEPTRAVERWLQSFPVQKGCSLSVGGLDYTGSPDGVLSAGKLRWTAHDAAVTALVLAPGGRVLWSASIDGTVARWDPATGTLLGRLSSPG